MSLQQILFGFFELLISVLISFVLIIATYRVILAVTHRPPDDPDRPLLPALDDLPAYTGLHLSELSEEAMRSLVTAHLGGELPLALLEAVLRRAQGNPFFVEELAENVNAFEAALNQAGIPNVITIYENQPHAFVTDMESIRSGGVQGQAWAQMLEFLEKYLKQDGASQNPVYQSAYALPFDWEYYLLLVYEHTFGTASHHY